MVNNDNLVSRLRTVAYYSPYDHNTGNPYWSTGSIGLGTNIMNGRINLSNGNNTGTRIVFGPSSSASNLNYCSLIESNNVFSTNYGSDLRFYTHGTATNVNSTERMRIDSSGNIGIGTTAPQATIDLGSVASDKKIGLAIQTTNFWGLGANNSANEYQVPTGASHVFYVGSTTTSLGTEYMRINSTGYVGIGTASPGYALDVASAVGINNRLFGTQGTNDLFWIGLKGTNTTEANRLAIGINTLNANIADGLVDNIRFLTNGTERLRINSSGNVGINTTSPTYSLDINGHMGLYNGSTIYAKNSSGAYEVFCHPRWTDNVTYMNMGSAGFKLRTNDGVTDRIIVGSTGYFGIGTVPTTPFHVVCPANAQILIESVTNPGYGFKTTVSSVVRSAAITLKSGATDKALQFYNQTTTGSEVSYNFLNGTAER